MSRLNQTLPLLCLDHVERLRCDRFEEDDLSSVPVCCQRLSIPAESYYSLPELEQAEVELVPS